MLFLPALSDKPLPPSKDYEVLMAKQRSYQLPVAEGKWNGGNVMKKLSGKRIEIPENKYGFKEVSFAMGEESGKNGGAPVKQMLMTIVKEDGSSYVQPLGYGQWSTDTIAGYPPYSINPIEWHRGLEGPFYAAGSYGWEKNRLNVILHYVNWVTSLDLQFEFNGDTALLKVSNNYTKNKVESFECKIF